MSQYTNLLQTTKEGLLLVGLPKTSELIVQVLCRKTGRNAAEMIGASLEHLATKILDAEEQKDLIKLLRDASN